MVAAAAVVAFAAGFPGAGSGATSPSATPTATATGTVTVDGARFTSGKVPFGSLVDIHEYGSLTLKTGVGTLEVTGVGDVPAAFVLHFIHVRGQPYVQLELAKGDFGVCPRRKTASATAPSAAAKTVVRALWGDGKGNFQTRGRFAAATVRGTYWQTDDRCDGTWLHVVRGVVDMTDFKSGRTYPVRAGHTRLVFAK